MSKNDDVIILSKNFSELLKQSIHEKEHLSIIGDEAYLFYSTHMNILDGSDFGEVLKILSGMEFEPDLFSYKILEDLVNNLSTYNSKEIKSFIIKYKPN
tara:strand:- start:10412 stop:10708 length:297 start_codon:yes stop_codon:yes gene_type:complete